MSGSSRIVAGLVAALVAAALAVWYFLPRAATNAQAEPAASPVAPRSASDEVERAPAPAPDPAAPVETRVEEPTRAPEPPSGDLFALLAWLEPEGRGPLPKVVADADSFAALFASQSLEKWVEAGPYLKHARDPLNEGTTLALDPGVWKLEGLDQPGVPLPRDVTLAGSGMMSTLVLIGGLKPKGNVERFTLRDCTVFTDNRPLFDLVAGYAGISFERVRFVGWDSGVGFAPLVRAKGLGVRMADCELLGGYGRAPGSGCLFEVPSSALLARLERCRLVALRTALERWKPGVSVVFSACGATDAIDAPEKELAAHPGVALEGSNFTPLAEGTRPAALQLEQLFPRWQQRLK